MPVLDARENNDDQTDARPTSVWEGHGQQMMYDDVMSSILMSCLIMALECSRNLQGHSTSMP